MSGFGQEQARRYEAWFDTPFGRRADLAEKRIAAHLLRYFPDARSVLEVGCGTGHFARWFAGRGLYVAGLDMSAPMLAASNEISPGLEVVRGDAMRLPFASGSFDLVAIITALEFFERPEVALAEAARVARLGLLLGVLNRRSPIALWRRLRSGSHKGVYGEARFYTRRELECLVKEVLGAQAGDVLWETGLYPLSWCDNLNKLPLGAFIGMSVRLNREVNPQAAR